MLCDYLKQRPEQLIVEIYRGSIDAMHDCLLHTDIVIGIEIIEHLFPETLENVPFNIFGTIKPKIVVFTTPNADFNVLFDMTTQFRHYDHKFEWSREQFEDWALNLCVRYPDYMVSFHGIGPAPPDQQHLGCVSQLALFVRCDFWHHTNGTGTIAKHLTSEGVVNQAILPSVTFEETNRLHLNEEVGDKVTLVDCCNEVGEMQKGTTDTDTTNDDYWAYKLLYRHSYPMRVDGRSRDQRLLDEAKFQISRFEYMDDQYLNFDRYVFEVPLRLVSDSIMQEEHTIDELRCLLIKNNYKITEGDVIEFEPDTESGKDDSDYDILNEDCLESAQTVGEFVAEEELWC